MWGNCKLRWGVELEDVSEWRDMGKDLENFWELRNSRSARAQRKMGGIRWVSTRENTHLLNYRPGGGGAASGRWDVPKEAGCDLSHRVTAMR